MTANSAKTLLAYNRWANERTLDSVDALSDDELNREFAVSFGSLQATLVHIFGVEWCYLQRWAGVSPPRLPGTEDFSDIPSVRKLWDSVLKEQDRFVAALTDEKLRQALGYINFKGEPMSYPLGDMVHHMVNHSTYHRGQVVFLLRMLGKKPTSTDFLLYFDEQQT